MGKNFSFREIKNFKRIFIHGSYVIQHISDVAMNSTLSPN